jgi:VWFA-related protein
LFRADVNLVEIHTAVFDRRGRHLTGLTRQDFEIRDGAQPGPPEIFESAESPIAIGLLLDVTGSMYDTLPLLKRAAIQLVESLREDDRVALFAFNDRMSTVADFDSDQRAIAAAIRRLQAGGHTALFDALARASQRMLQRQGKKVLVVFTDGNDNASVLTLNSALDRSRRNGLQIHAVAQGEALRHRKLMDTLEDIAKGTGGLAFKVQKASEIQEVFSEISRDLAASYLLGFRPRPGRGEWRPLEVTLPRQKDARVRCRSGYYATAL